MFKRIHEYNYIKKIRKVMAQTSMLKYLILNGYRHSACQDLLRNRISEDFYKTIFCGGDAQLHYTEINAENIKNYTFFKKKGLTKPLVIRRNTSKYFWKTF